MATLAEKSLYERLGGYNAIAKIISDLYDRMLGHPYIWYYWKGRSADGEATECRLFTDFVCISAGRPDIYPDGDMKPAYQGLGISKVEVSVFVGLAGETLVRSGLKEREQEELFSLLTKSKAAITAPDLPASPIAGFAGYAPGLTDREKEVLRLVALGKNNSEIAEELFISVNTVTRHLTNIFFKTGTANRVQAAVYAAQRRIV